MFATERSSQCFCCFCCLIAVVFLLSVQVIDFMPLLFLCSFSHYGYHCTSQDIFLINRRNISILLLKFPRLSTCFLTTEHDFLLTLQNLMRTSSSCCFLPSYFTIMQKPLTTTLTLLTDLHFFTYQMNPGIRPHLEFLLRNKFHSGRRVQNFV